MIKVYGIPNCNTVKKAIDWLKEKGLTYEFHDYKKSGIIRDKLEEWTKHFGWENVLNKKGTTWTSLSVTEKAAVTNEEAAIDLMINKTSAIKRPIIEANGKYLIRFNEEEYRNAIL